MTKKLKSLVSLLVVAACLSFVSCSDSKSSGTPTPPPPPTKADLLGVFESDGGILLTITSDKLSLSKDGGELVIDVVDGEYTEFSSSGQMKAFAADKNFKAEGKVTTNTFVSGPFAEDAKFLKESAQILVSRSL